MILFLNFFYVGYCIQKELLRPGFFYTTLSVMGIVCSHSVLVHIFLGTTLLLDTYSSFFPLLNPIFLFFLKKENLVLSMTISLDTYFFPSHLLFPMFSSSFLYM